MSNIAITKPELIWPDKYDEEGRRVVNQGVALLFQVVETIREGRASREPGLFSRCLPLVWLKSGRVSGNVVARPPPGPIIPSRSLKRHAPVVLGATGGLETMVAAMLAAAQWLTAAVINPRQAKDFAKPLGRRAKTRALDTRAGPVWSDDPTRTLAVS